MLTHPSNKKIHLKKVLLFSVSLENLQFH